MYYYILLLLKIFFSLLLGKKDEKINNHLKHLNIKKLILSK